MENVRNKKKIEFIKNDKKDIITQQAKSIFNGIGISDENYDNYTFKQNETLMDQQICLGFAIIELSNLLMYETLCWITTLFWRKKYAITLFRHW